MPVLTFAKFVVLCACRRALPRATRAAELAVLAAALRSASALPSPPPAGTTTTTSGARSDGGARALTIALEALSLPVLLLRGIRALDALTGGRARRMRQREAASEAAAVAAATAGGACRAPLPVLPPARSALEAFQMDNEAGAAEYKPWLDLLRARLPEPLPDGYDADGLELWRLCLSAGLPEASSPAQALSALSAVERTLPALTQWWAACSKAEWAARARPPAGATSPSPGDFPDVMWWAGPDAQGFMWLHLDARAALARCGGDASTGTACTAELVWQLEAMSRVVIPAARHNNKAAGGSGNGGWRGAFSRADAGAPPPAHAPPLQDRFMVAIHCNGVGPGRAARLAGMLRVAASTVTHNYPHRLCTCYLVDLPSAMALFAGALLGLLPAVTRAKVKACRHSAVPWPSSAAATALVAA